MAWQYYAMRWTGEWVHRELPLGDVRIIHTLSGPGGLAATIDPTDPALLTEAGDLVLRPWDTIILAEASGQLRGGGILISTETAGDRLTLDCVGFAGYPAGMPLTSTLAWGGKTVGVSGTGVDPATVIRALWAHLQAQPDGGLGVTVDPLTTPYRLGAWHNARKLPTVDEPKPPAAEVEDPPIPIDRVWTPQDRKPAAATGKTVWWDYVLPWWESIEVGSKIDELCQQASIDYREQWAWASSSRESVLMRLELGYPRLGRRRTSLRLVEGENISELVTVRRDGEDYANTIIAYGAGEGSKQLRATTARRDGRLRRAQAVDAPDLGSDAALRAVAAAELNVTSQIEDIAGFVLLDSPSAPVGAIEPGDDVLVQTTVGWRPTQMWVRVTQIEIEPGRDTMQVTCSRSDRFART